MRALLEDKALFGVAHLLALATLGTAGDRRTLAFAILVICCMGLWAQQMKWR